MQFVDKEVTYEIEFMDNLAREYPEKISLNPEEEWYHLQGEFFYTQRCNCYVKLYHSNTGGDNKCYGEFQNDTKGLGESTKALEAQLGEKVVGQVRTFYQTRRFSTTGSPNMVLEDGTVYNWNEVYLAIEDSTLQYIRPWGQLHFFEES